MHAVTTPLEQLVLRQQAQTIERGAHRRRLRPIFCPARVTWRSVINASNATSRLRSTTARFTVGRPANAIITAAREVNARNLWMIARSRCVGFRAAASYPAGLDIQTLDLDYQIIRLAHTKGRSNNSRWPTQMRPSCLDGTHDCSANEGGRGRNTMSTQHKLRRFVLACGLAAFATAALSSPVCTVAG